MSEHAIPTPAGVILTALMRGRGWVRGRSPARGRPDVQTGSDVHGGRDAHRAAAVPGSYELSWHESLRLLTDAPVGRIVYSDHALPAVQPVNFVVDDEAVVFRAGEGSRLARAVENAVVAFEADEYDPAAGTGWSVAVIGKCVTVSEPGDVERLSRRVPPHWAPIAPGRFVRISIAELSGRQIGPRRQR
jgi:uncharacterized protein